MSDTTIGLEWIGARSASGLGQIAMLGYLPRLMETSRNSASIEFVRKFPTSVEGHLAGQPGASVGVMIGQQAIIYFESPRQLYHLRSELKRVKPGKLQPVGQLLSEQRGNPVSYMLTVDNDTPVGAHTSAVPGQHSTARVMIGRLQVELKDRLALMSMMGALDQACHVAQDTFVFANARTQDAPRQDAGWLPAPIGIRLDCGALVMPRAD